MATNQTRHHSTQSNEKKTDTRCLLTPHSVLEVWILIYVNILQLSNREFSLSRARLKTVGARIPIACERFEINAINQNQVSKNRWIVQFERIKFFFFSSSAASAGFAHSPFRY